MSASHPGWTGARCRPRPAVLIREERYADTGRRAAAVARLRRALAMNREVGKPGKAVFARALGPRHPNVVACRENLALAVGAPG